MSGNTEPDVDAQEKTLSLSHTRILWTMAGVVLIGTIAGFIFADAGFGAGFLIGGILAFVNYFWLKSALKNVFEKTSESGNASFLTLNYFLRYAAIGFVLYAIYLVARISMIAVLLGAGAFAFAILIEGLIIIFSSFSKREDF